MTKTATKLHQKVIYFETSYFVRIIRITKVKLMILRVVGSILKQKWIQKQCISKSIMGSRSVTSKVEAKRYQTLKKGVTREAKGSTREPKRGPKGAKASRNEPQRSAKEALKGQKQPQREPKGKPREPKEKQMESKGTPKGPQREPKRAEMNRKEAQRRG